MQSKDPIDKTFRLKEPQMKALKKLGIETLEDLLYHFPVRYSDPGETKRIGDLKPGEKATVYGRLEKLKTKKAFRKKIPMAQGQLRDESGTIDVTWFHQPYIAKMLSEGAAVKLAGKVGERNGKLYFANPEYEPVGTLPISVSKDELFEEARNEVGIVPTYPESRGISSLWFYTAVHKLLTNKVHEKIEDPLPSDILKKYNLPSLKTALVWMHKPKKDSDSESARKRFAFEEIFSIQLERHKRRREHDTHPSFSIEVGKEDVENFIKRFPFSPTKSQQRVIAEIVKDLKTKHAMARLLEGDVGSGKTFVAAATSYAVVTNRPAGQDYGNLQVAYMAPTEVLATQLFESFIEYFSHLPIQIGLLTGSGARKFPSKANPKTWTNISKPQLLKWVKNGEVAILIGTHALIQKKVEFENLAYTIVDEQHRFGVNQRAQLIRKDGMIPHLLSMTATPIPRTLALTIYGDLDLSLLDKMPPGRKKPITEIVPPDKREAVYEKAREELESGRQTYVICPRINEPDPEKESALQVRSVKEEARRLGEEIFPEYEIAELHGGMRPKEKESVMDRFHKHEIDVLVSTSVIEVGVNVPNATVIIIEGADRFGLAQLHQLRGRVQRSTHQAYCYVFTDSKSKRTQDRLKALEKAQNGFELAEKDLMMRGSGTLSGEKQWGISDIGMEAIKNIKMVEAARNEAERLINEDPELKNYPLLKEKMLRSSQDLHFE